MQSTVAGSGTESAEDVGQTGTELIQRTSDQALGMHARLAKMFGLKMQ